MSSTNILRVTTHQFQIAHLPVLSSHFTLTASHEAGTITPFYKDTETHEGCGKLLALRSPFLFCLGKSISYFSSRILYFLTPHFTATLGERGEGTMIHCPLWTIIL